MSAEKNNPEKFDEEALKKLIPAAEREKNAPAKKLYEAGIILAGSLLYAMAINMFLTPASVVMGGATGIATVANHLFNAPVGMVIMLVNLPLLLINMKMSGVRSLLKTLVGIVCTSVAVDALAILFQKGIFPVTITDPLLCAVFGGVCMGAGAGIMFTRGYTTGGSDLAAAMLHRCYRRISTGRYIMIVDGFIIIGAALITRNFTGIMYSLVASVSYMLMIDGVMGGSDKAKLALIVSDKYKMIADEIFDELGRGVTVLYGRGWYTKEDKCVLMCVVKRSELYRVKLLVQQSDPKAFMILSDASEVLGYGFKAS